MGALQRIETLTKNYADARSLLADEVARLQDEIDAAKRRRLAKVKALFAALADAKGALANEIERNPGEFERPRTFVFHGVKVGYRKQVGEITFGSEQSVIDLLKKKFPERTESTIRVTEKLIVKALAEWSAADLKKIGCNVESDSDAIVIKATETEIDRMIAAMEKDLDKDLGSDAGSTGVWTA